MLRTTEGIDVAGYRIAGVKADDHALGSVGHCLAAIEAMSLHLQFMESRSQFFAAQRGTEKVGASLPRINEVAGSTGI